MSPHRRLHPAWLLLGATWLLIAGFIFLSRSSPAPLDAVAEVPALAPAPHPEPGPKPPRPAAATPRPTHTARPTFTAAPTFVSTPRLRVRVLEATERRPLPWATVCLSPVGTEPHPANPTAYADAEGIASFDAVWDGRYQVHVWAGDLPEVPNPVELSFDHQDTSERMIEVLYPGFAPVQFEVIKSDGTALPGFKFHVGYDWVPYYSRGVGMEQSSLGYSLELVSDSNGFVTALLPPKVDPYSQSNVGIPGVGEDAMDDLNQPPSRSVEPTGAWLWPDDRHALIGLRYQRWQDLVNITAALGGHEVQEQGKPLIVFANPDAARVSVRLLNTSPLPLGSRYLLTGGLGDRGSIRMGDGPQWRPLDRLPFEGGLASFTAPMGAKGNLEVVVAEYDVRLPAVRDDKPPLRIERAVELPKDQKDVELLIDVAGGVKLVGKAVLPSGKPAVGVSFIVEAMADDMRNRKIETKETSITNAEGEFEVLLHAAAEYILELAPASEAYKPGPYYFKDGSPIFTQKQVEAGPVTVELSPSGSIWGQVVDADGKGLTGFALDALNFGTDDFLIPFHVQATTDGAGYFTINLPPRDEAGKRMFVWGYRDDFATFAAAEVSSGEKIVLKAVPRSEVPLPPDIVDVEGITIRFRVPGLQEPIELRASQHMGPFEFYPFRPTAGPQTGRTWVSNVPVGIDAEILVNGKPIIRVLPDPAGDKPGSFVAQELPRGE